MPCYALHEERWSCNPPMRFANSWRRGVVSAGEIQIRQARCRSVFRAVAMRVPVLIEVPEYLGPYLIENRHSPCNPHCFP